ncbi:MAG: MBL fold metallo-hydrolase [Clostridiales bacterium]|nr:MBL fold metallo-hydrolase [Clostridiales bacterium]
MRKILATIKAPKSMVAQITQQLKEAGVEKVAVQTVSYSQFVEESRLNYDCVFPQMWEEKAPVAYIHFAFDGTDEGRTASFQVEYDVMQIPLNLHYGSEIPDPVKCRERYRTVTKDTLVVRDKVEDWLYILDEVNSSYMYLIVGQEKALLFDTGYGFTEWRHLITEVTDLPLYVVCSHGHDDHVLGCFQFEEAYIAEEDYDLCVSNDNPGQKEKQILSRRQKTPDIDELVDRDAYFRTSFDGCTFKFVKDGDVFDLGGITLQVYAMPGHTKGSIALYCPEKKAVFVGDCLVKNHQLAYGQSLAVSSPPQDFIRSLGRLEKLDIDIVWPAHGDVPAERELISDTREMLIDFAHNGDPEKDEEKRDPNSIRMMVFGDPNQRHGKYKYKDIVMGYDMGHLDQIRAYMAEHDGAVE